MDKIYMFSKKTITCEELTKLYINLSYDELVNKVNELTNKKILSAKLKSGTNGRNPILFKKYGVELPKEDYSDIVDEIKRLNAFLSINYYLNKPKEYKKDREYILKLNDFVIYHYDRLLVQMSINERSFDIWGEEKFLRKSPTLLSNLGLNYDKLNVYNTPEPFFSEKINIYSNNVLIIENKDTWFTLRKILMEENKNILGLNIGLLIYGEGKKIISSIEYLNHKDFSFLNNPTIYYWGDIDYEGINIIYSLSKKVELKIFTNAYSEMLRKIKDVKSLKEMSNDQVKTKDLEQFLSSFDDYDRNKINEILENNKYIPQEILNYKILMEEG
jgi:hypothetical protein